MRVFTLRSDDANGDAVHLFTDEQAADAAALNWCKKHWFKDHDCPDNWADAYEQLGDCEAFMSYEEHQIDNTLAVQSVINAAKAQMADLIEQINQMKGMCSDADGRIQQAIDDAEAWPGLPATPA